jgi:hypothetical protein
VGKDADGTWELTVRIPGGETKHFANLPAGSPDFRNLTWIGWCSMAAAKTSIFLDGLTVKNEG